MTREEMVTRWEARDAADAYILGFVRKGMLYAIRVNRIPEDAIKLNISSKDKHGNTMQTLRLKLSNALQDLLIAQGATLLGGEELVAKEAKMNSGEKFEKLIIEWLTGKRWKKDSTPYWLAGDVKVNGEQLQIKFNNATLTTSKALG